MSEKTFKIVGNDISDGYHTFDELYEHRCLLFCMLLTIAGAQDALPMGWELDAWRSRKHHDGTFIKDWFIAGIKLPNGTITYHLPMKCWPMLSGYVKTLDNAPEWDGHTSNDVINRMTDWLFLNGVKKELKFSGDIDAATKGLFEAFKVVIDEMVERKQRKAREEW